MFLNGGSFVPMAVPPKKDDASSASSVKSGKSVNSNKSGKSNSKRSNSAKDAQSSNGAGGNGSGNGSFYASSIKSGGNQSTHNGFSGGNGSSIAPSSMYNESIASTPAPPPPALPTPPAFSTQQLPHHSPLQQGGTSFSQPIPSMNGGGGGYGGSAAAPHHTTYTSALHSVPEPFDEAVELDQHRSALQWLQQTCRPVFVKELTQITKVPVPITAATAKHPSMIGGMRHIQTAIWKQSKVQIVPVERWGKPDDVLHEMQLLHKLRKCRQIIQLYGYLPNSNPSAGQIPALLIQQPSYGSLRQFLDHHFDTIQWPERYKLGLDMAQGLKFLASQGLGCDLHSGSVLVDGEGVAVLTGFGVPGGMIASAPCHMTAQLSVSQQAAYMAPERLAGKLFSTEWVVFSLGILLWELASGRPPFEEIITRAEQGPRLAKNMEHLTGAIIKGLREEMVMGIPEIYEQLIKMCWEGDAESRPPLEVVEETLQMLVVVEPMDMLMLPGDDLGMSISTIVSDSIDGDAISTHIPTRTNSVRSLSPVPNTSKPFTRPTNLHQAISVSNADMTEWYILSGHDVNGYALVGTYSAECEITPILTCLGHFLPVSLPILRDLLEQDVDVNLKVKRSLQNCFHVLLDRYIPIKNDNGSAHLMAAVDLLIQHKVDPNALDIQGYTPLHLLMRNPKISSDDVNEVYKRMVVAGADTSIMAPKDGNVLALAAKYLHFEVMKSILMNDILASDEESIEKAIEGCMTMTGRSTDKFVNLRSKCRELLKLWTGTAAKVRREKVVLKVLTDAGYLSGMGIRTKTAKPVAGAMIVPATQLAEANRYYDANMARARELLVSGIGFAGGTGLFGGR